MKIEASAMQLYAITDRSWLKPGETLEQVVEVLLANGITCLQLREKHATHQQMVEEGRKLLPLCRRYGVPFIINDDVYAAKEIGADGVHVGQSDMDLAHARRVLGEGAIIGTSAHNVREAQAAVAAGADYLGSGAVFGSTTKTDAGNLPREELCRICKAVSIPVTAIGGIGRENISALSGTGVDGVAVISALFAPEDKASATRELLELSRTMTGK